MSEVRKNSSMYRNGKIKIGCYIDENIVNKLDNYCKENGLSRTAAISVLISQQIDQMEALKTMSKFVNMEQILKNNNIEK